MTHSAPALDGSSIHERRVASCVEVHLEKTLADLTIGQSLRLFAIAVHASGRMKTSRSQQAKRPRLEGGSRQKTMI
jgi:alkylhydroperoxidase/carboxymuconolactone decarboxylase family protein YurZ